MILQRITSIGKAKGTRKRGRTRTILDKLEKFTEYACQTRRSFDALADRAKNRSKWKRRPLTMKTTINNLKIDHNKSSLRRNGRSHALALLISGI